MPSIQRREKIHELLKEDGEVNVVDLASIFKVSDVTIRQDLEKMENDGLITREHGGAYLNSIEDHVKNFSLLNLENADKKKLIGSKAAELIHAGDTIILDSGTTTTEIARALLGRKHIRVITNALNIAIMLGSEPGIEVMMTGGEFKPPTLSLTGQKAADSFRNLHADKLFLATAGISLRTGLTYPSLSDIVVKNAMIESAEITYLVADSSKLGKNAFASLGALSLIDYFITDTKCADKKEAWILIENEVEFIYAE